MVHCAHGSCRQEQINRWQETGFNMSARPTDADQATLATVQGSCIRCHIIDSWQKLHILLWLHAHREQKLTCQELIERLYLGDEGMVKTMLIELRQAGFLVEADGRCALSGDSDVEACLQYLEQMFADPVTRQELITRLRQVRPYDPGGRDYYGID